MESSSKLKLGARELLQRITARIRASAWTPLVAKVAVGMLGFFALAFVGSGAAADLLPNRMGTYLGPPTVPSAAMPAASAHPSTEPMAHAAPVPSGQTLAAADAGAPEADAGPAKTEGAVTPDGKVILNLATEADLRKLPGIGAKKAQAILALRAKLGRFKRPEDLLRVKGIGRKRLAKLRPRLLIDPPDKP